MTKKLRIISLMIGLALLGIIYFQVQWIMTSYTIWQEQFDTNVREALTSTIEKNLQNKIYSLSKSYVLPQGPGKTKIKVFAEDSLADIKSLMVSIDKSDLIFTEDFEEYRSFINMNDSLSFVVQKELNELDEDLDVKISGQSIIRMSKSLPADSLIVKKCSDNDQLKTKKGEWLDTLIEDVFETKIEWNSVNYRGFKNSLEKELLKTDIELPFQLGIFDINNNSYEYVFPEDGDTSLLKLGYKAPIMGKRDQSDFASLYFPEQNSFILKKLMPTLIGSLLLFLITAGSFILMFQTLFRQKKLSELKSDFMNNMTHELKTPISTVSLTLEALQDFDGLKDTKRTEKYLGIARNENNRLGMLVNKILKMSIYEQSKLQLQLEACNVNESIEKVCQNFDVQLQQADGVLSKSLQENIPNIKADRVHFNNVIYNLLDNGVKYSGSPPQIQVVTRKADNTIEIKISDNGKGIAKQNQQKIFDKFYRIPSGNIHKVKGHGLGLSYVKKIVEAHGGKVLVQSKPEKGSTFILRFPV